VGTQTTTVLQAARQNGEILSKAGIRPTGADLYIMHQQGPAGGEALLTAPVGMSAVAALTPAYRGNAAVATQAIAGNLGMPYRTPAEREAANERASTMSASDFVQLWRGKFSGAGGASGSGQYPSIADALNANMANTLAQAQTTAEKLFPNGPDAPMYQERYVEAVQRRLEQQVDQLKRNYDVDTHTVQAAMDATKPISEQELMNSSPQVAAAWQSVQVNNPYAAAGIERMFDANARGQAMAYGSQFKSYLDRALAPSTDPDRVTNASQLWTNVGPGPDSPLTNTGVSQISGLLALRGSPQGETQAAQIKGFVDQMHGQLTFSNAVTGVYDERGEAAYSKFISQSLPVLVNAAKNGTLGKILDPNSPDYLGKTAQPFMRSQTDIMDDQLKHSSQAPTATNAYTPQTLGRDLDSLDNDAQRRDALEAAVKSGRLTAPVYQAYLASKAGTPGVPAGPPSAPEPTFVQTNGAKF
jgi:hypothetical protein